MLLSTIFLLALLTLYWFGIASRHPNGFPPGPGFALPIIGNAFNLGTDLARGVEELRKKYGDVVGLFLGPNRSVIVSDFDTIQEVGGHPNFANKPKLEGMAYLRGGYVSSGDTMSPPGKLLKQTGLLWSRTFIFRCLFVQWSYLG